VTGAETARLLLDEMLSGTIAAQLRTHGLDVTAAVEDGSLVSTPDEDLLAYAAEHHRILVTANIADFAAIANDWRAAGRTHHGLIYVANRTFPQNRSFIGSVTDALAILCTSTAIPALGTEVFLSRSQP
jgi:predicted nuclease of predicted toxin-antitoxin system